MEFYPTSQIKIDCQNVPVDVANHWREIIEILITQKALNVKNGKAILNFDSDGNLAEISFDYKKWRRGKK